MMDNHIRNEVEMYMRLYIVSHTTSLYLEKLQQERQEAGEEREFHDIPVLDKILRKKYLAYGTPLDTKFEVLGQICEAVNRNSKPILLQELKETLTNMVRKQYDMTFEGMITSPGNSVSDKAVQLAREDFVKGCDSLLKGELEQMLNRIEVREGKYDLKKEE